jgi:hypothetical protein
LKLGKNVKEAYKALKTFGEQTRGTANFWAVFQVQKWYGTC